MPTHDDIQAWRARLSADDAEISGWLLATIYVMTREINTLREALLLPPRTKAQVFTALRNTAANLEDE